jgi:hypothetical protein
MNVFDLRERLVNDYADYTRSFINIRDEGIRDLVDREVAEGLLWPNPILQLNPAFEPGETIDELAEAGVLDAECRRIFRRDKTNDEPDGKPLRLHRHQAEAIKVARSGANYVLTTGTGSGKSLTYIIPIVDHVLRRGSGKGIRARAVSRPLAAHRSVRASMVPCTTVDASPTIPSVASWKIGAFGSVFTATMLAASFIPITCWAAPLSPTAM